MNTPERSKVGTPASKVEDSPVFSFINSLSPIQPVKSTHSAQAYHTLSFASISSVFTSPHANLQREARIPIRDSVSDLPKHETSSDNGGANDHCVGTSNVVKPSLSAGTRSLSEAAAVDNSVECSNSSCDLPQPLAYDCHSPHHNATPCHVIKSELKSVLDNTPDELVEYDEDCLAKTEILFSTKTELQDEQTEAKVADHNWDDLISNDADNLMIFDSSAELDACEVPAKNVPCIEQSEVVRDQDETGHRCRVFSENCENQAFISDRNQEMGHGSTSGISIACKIESQQQRGMRRRCLNFEGVPEMGLQNDSTACYSNGAHPASNIPPVPFKAGNPLTCIVPGIGLHLNSLGLKDRFLSRETLVSGQRLISMPGPICPFHSTTGLEPHDKSLSVDKDLVTGSGIHNLSIMHDDVSQSSALISGKDLHQSSPKKKRRKLEIGAENREGCKRCNCKKSKCLKLYCECFAAGVFCAEPCSCQSCFNKPIHQETVLNIRKQIESRNPLAFAPKVIRPSDPDQEIGEEVNKTPASARHKRGCNCKKSSCLKKYCECYQGGVGCSVSCRCEGCKNAFGRKDGSLPIEDEEFEQEEEQKEAYLNVSDGLDAGEQSADPTNDELQYPESVLQLTPFQVIRPSMDIAILSSGQTPLSSSLTTVTSAGFNSFANMRRFEMPLSHCKLGKHVRVDSEDETPAILEGNVSPINSVKATSPNQKRVSPPQFRTRLSPNHKGGRRLILKSIPSFPSLNNDSSHEISANYSDSSLDMPTQS